MREMNEITRREDSAVRMAFSTRQALELNVELRA